VLDHVWAVARARGFTTGHNVFVYRPEAGMLYVELGVEVDRPFNDLEGVVCTATPAGRAATAVHVGPHDQLGRTHDAVVAWCAAHEVPLTGIGWEVYGDTAGDPSRSRTDVFHQVA
jgi:effector-binding domain-containing protein